MRLSVDGVTVTVDVREQSVAVAGLQRGVRAVDEMPGVEDGGDALWLDPGEPEAVEHSLRVLDEIVRNYDIDGLHFDDYFYPYPKGKLTFPDDESFAKYQASGGKLIRFIRNAPDGFVTTDQDGTVVTANVAFLQMAQLMTEDQVRGQPIDRWLGRSDVDMRVVIANAK